ncbi:hypothetical protein Bealeia1_02049 (plasmid) [Candidatus Bealeia paramacronuclearis]|uniref:Uncharacterized protein n=1 Tax=Candidatus Bealeia paramacronuclearis TaxID=1921001 RepID=A0ABZ2C9X9_9PROT
METGTFAPNCTEMLSEFWRKCSWEHPQTRDYLRDMARPVWCRWRFRRGADSKFRPTLFLLVCQKIVTSPSQKCRRDSLEWYQSHWRDRVTISPSQKQKARLKTPQAAVYTTSVGSSISGLGGDILMPTTRTIPKTSSQKRKMHSTNLGGAMSGNRDLMMPKPAP